jgi:hypothetical protein
MSMLNSPLSGQVRSGFGGARRHRSKILFGTAIIAFVPFLLSTFAASVTVGSGALEFGQGSQQAVACDEVVYVALSQEWHSAPQPNDPSYGFFRIKSVTVSNLDLLSCRDKRLRVRLINVNGQEIQVGGTAGANVLQVTLPDSDAPVNTSDPVALRLTYLTGGGDVISGTVNASVAVSVSGTSIYDGSVLTPQSSDVTFYLDPTAQVVNIDGQIVGRTTVETMNNPKPMNS